MKDFFEIEPDDNIKFKPMELPNMGIPENYFNFDTDNNISDNEKRYESYINKFRSEFNSKFEFDPKDFMEQLEKQNKIKLRQKKLDSL